MERREALKALAIITGGAVLVPSCNFSNKDILAAYSNLQVTPTLQKLLGSVTDTIIPAGSIKGAADINVQDFILVMVNDCMNEEQQSTFMTGLSAFDAYSKKTGGKSFEKLTPEARTSVVQMGLALAKEQNGEEEHTAAPNPDEAIADFLKITKRFTIQGFMMSEYIQTEIKPYEMIPEKYNGAVLLAELKKEVIHG